MPVKAYLLSLYITDVCLWIPI